MAIPTSRRAFLLAAAGLPALSRTIRKKLAGIEFEIIENGPSRRSYLLIHGDESTARGVLLKHMQTSPGKACLVAGSERRVKLQGLWIDPNRLFSRAGADINLKKLNERVSGSRIKTALDWLDHRRPALINALLPPPGGLLVALHNNSKGYSLEEELPISDRSSLPARQQPHEFMLVTSEADFAILAKSPHNVLLQKNAPPDDDGSLSRLCAARGVRYVNIEAGIGKAEQQTAMLDWIEQNLP